MKGVIFVNLLDFVEQHIGLTETEKLLQVANLPSRGAYTTVGSYDVSEIATIVSHASAQTGLRHADLYRAFGRFLFGRLASAHPEFISGAEDPLTLISRVEEHIHVEVRKLYPDAQLPTLSHDWVGDELVLVYRSARHLEDLCEGLIHGCFDHYGSQMDLRRSPSPGAVRFRIGFAKR